MLAKTQRAWGAKLGSKYSNAPVDKEQNQRSQQNSLLTPEIRVQFRNPDRPRAVAVAVVLGARSTSGSFSIARMKVISNSFKNTGCASKWYCYWITSGSPPPFLAARRAPARHPSSQPGSAAAR